MKHLFALSSFRLTINEDTDGVLKILSKSTNQKAQQHLLYQKRVVEEILSGSPDVTCLCPSLFYFNSPSFFAHPQLLRAWNRLAILKRTKWDISWAEILYDKNFRLQGTMFFNHLLSTGYLDTLKKFIKKVEFWQTLKEGRHSPCLTVV